MSALRTEPPHLASVEAIDPGPAGRVLSLPWKLFTNACICLLPLVVMLIPISVTIAVSRLASISALAWIGASLLISVLALFGWTACFPEWPFNLLTVRRLRNRIKQRITSSHQTWLQHDEARMVEWVPRENWQATKLDTAEDIMLIHVDTEGVHLEGDRYRYHLPPGSIIDVHAERIRPTGCLHTLHFVIVTVRTHDGPIEFPLAYRDHNLGHLSSAARRRQTLELCQSIAGIAAGGDFTYHPAESPIVSAPHSNVASDNPYAVPRAV